MGSLLHVSFEMMRCRKTRLGVYVARRGDARMFVEISSKKAVSWQNDMQFAG